MTARDIREALTKHYADHKAELVKLHEYSQTAQALSLEYHTTALGEAFPDIGQEELVCIEILDARETPASLDKKIQSLQEYREALARIIWNPVEYKFYVFVDPQKTKTQAD